MHIECAAMRKVVRRLFKIVEYILEIMEIS